MPLLFPFGNTHRINIGVSVLHQVVLTCSNPVNHFVRVVCSMMSDLPYTQRLFHLSFDASSAQNMQITCDFIHKELCA